MDGFRRLQDRYHREDSLTWSRRRAPSASLTLEPMPWISAGTVFSKTSTGAGAAKVIRSTARGGPAHRRRSSHREAAGPARGAVAVGAPVEVEATWSIYQRMIAAYRHADRRRKAY